MKLVDGDRSLVISDKFFIEIAERNMKGIYPLFYNMRKAEPCELSYSSMYDGLKAAFTGGNIGIYSNNITKIWNSDVWINGSEEDKENALRVVKWLCMENNFTIDYAKTLYKPERPEFVNDEIKKYTKLKVPHFFVYAKDKIEDDVEPVNNSVVNRLNTIIENPKIVFPKLKFGKLEPEFLMTNPDIQLDEEIVKKYTEFNKKYHYMINVKDNKNNNLLYTASYIKSQLGSYGYKDDEVCDMLIKLLYCEKNSKTKELLWICYGDIIVENLNRNLDKKTKVCVKCGKRFEPYTNSQKYCLKCDCGYQKIGKKVLFCSDCGEQFVVNSKNNASKRCPDCYKIYRNKYNNDIKRGKRKQSNLKTKIAESLDFTGV